MVSTWPRPTRQIVVNWGCIGFVSGIWTARTLGETCIAFLFYVEALSARGRACHEAVSIIRLVTTTETRDFAYLDELPRERTYLLPALHLLRERGVSLPPAGLAAVSKRLRVPNSELYGVARSYSELRFEPPPERSVGLCTGLSCRLNGAEALATELRAAGRHVEEQPCRFLCNQAPVVAIGHPSSEAFGYVVEATPAKVATQAPELPRRPTPTASGAGAARRGAGPRGGGDPGGPGGGAP